MIAEVVQEERVGYVAEFDEQFTYTTSELRLPNGGRVVSLPGRDPDALAGFTGNVVLTEFGLFPNGGYPHWRVVFPLSSRGFRVIVISTPRGRNTKFYELVNDPETYSVHRCNIEQAVAEGYVLEDQHGEPTDLATFKKLYGDEAGWRREYLCEFTGDLDALVSWAQLTAAGERGRGEPFDLLELRGDAGWSPGWFRRCFDGESNGRIEIGWDVARKGDLSALWINHNPSPGSGAMKRLWCLVLMQDVSFELQREVVKSAMDAGLPAVGAATRRGSGRTRTRRCTRSTATAGSR
ncbi:MAG: hypothetical protein AAF800_00635 [Planctomycetota bacterium]